MTVYTNTDAVSTSFEEIVIEAHKFFNFVQCSEYENGSQQSLPFTTVSSSWQQMAFFNHRILFLGIPKVHSTSFPSLTDSRHSDQSISFNPVALCTGSAPVVTVVITITHITAVAFVFIHNIFKHHCSTIYSILDFIFHQLYALCIYYYRPYMGFTSQQRLFLGNQLGKNAELPFYRKSFRHSLRMQSYCKILYFLNEIER